MKTKHLDLGSGLNPRNPYDSSELYGIDIMDESSVSADFVYKKSNLATQKIPYPDNFFNSVSAFDFFEHIPRTRLYDNDEMSFPFIELMNEIYRVLMDGGRLYAVTPCYPMPQAFNDPTHVNFIARDTHQYFCGKDCYGRNYGFNGYFTCLQSKRISTKLAKKGANVSFFDRAYDYKRKLQGRWTHLLWEFEANKKLG